MPTIQERLKRATLAGPKSRYRLAQETGISEAALSLFVRGKRGIGLDLAVKLAGALGLRIVIVKAGKGRRKV